LVIKVKIPYSDKYTFFEDIKFCTTVDDFFEGNVPKFEVINFLEKDYYDELTTKRVIATRFDGSRLVIDFNTKAYMITQEEYINDKER